VIASHAVQTAIEINDQGRRRFWVAGVP